MVRKYSSVKYKTNKIFQTLVREYSKAKYKTNRPFQTYVRDYSKAKYKTNRPFQTYVRDYSKAKYKTNRPFQNFVREYSHTKYKKNITFQNKIKEHNKRRYQENENIRVNKIQKRRENYLTWQKKQGDIDLAIDRFRQEVSRGPEYVCSVCHRLLFRKQVVECKRYCYESKGAEVAALANRCITLQYLHVCNVECEQKCHLSDSPPSKLWICHTCHRKILGGKLPEESVTNNMHLDDIPPELKCLNSLEQHLIARHIPFMKLLCLPRGRQRACHGPCVSVPVNNANVTNILPRNECDDKMIRVKLKRKLTYKGHYEYMYVHTDRVRNALRYLMANNKWYGDVTMNDKWVNSLNGTDQHEESTKQETPANSDDENVPDEQAEEDVTYIKDQNGLLSDTSLQPVDLGSEIIDQNFQDILNVAPGEGNSPVRLLSDKTNEAKCFPVLYPSGGPTFHDERESKITLSRYLNTRILNADGRFAQNTDFIFYAQYISEVHQVVSGVSVALRKGGGNSSLKDASPDMLLNSDSLGKILRNDEGYKFLRGIRGTPPYWMSVQKDLFAMIRQLSIPTFFASFSSADLRWSEMLSSILRIEGKQTSVDDLDWSDKCGLIRRNPVTAARMFDHRWHCFLRDVIMSPAEPIGKIKDYFYRVEFQQRGSPHVHCLFWIENAPKIDRESDDEVAHFIDTYITCEIPPETDAELNEVVSSVQRHSTRHSKTCRKKNTVCRFNFPRPPSSRTFITRGGNCEDLNGNADDNTGASAIMKNVKTALTMPDMHFDTTDAFFESLGIDQGLFEKVYNICSKKKSIVLKRNPGDIWVNQYNTDLLRAWQGNMDIQYVTDAFSVVPVKGTPLFAENKGANLWDNNFEVAELTKVVRQENAAFAEMLNRLRVRKKNEPLTDCDVLTLRQRETGEESTDIHVYATNAEVDEYNVKRLQEICPDAITIRAQDFVRNPKTGRMERKGGFHTKVFNSCLPKCVLLGVGARVMLKKNIDVSDGLVNGACGTVVEIIQSQQDDDMPAAIHVEFEDPNVGKIQRSKAKRVSERSTIVEVQEEQVANNGGVRRQLPISLA
ncbi:uncharacterized protein LOC121715728 [Alosa sapidissima]|uniref:uncharacterized protein LOC121715728 n=1 Tax=Alosa sapidissima TaxID=34773 RepID=UPI001C09AE58|nr:uncharacterized protein LOC121715728 [Alosa sapidissima]